MNNYNPIIIELLRQRGITQEADVMEFLSEKPQKFYDPFLLLGMKAGVDFIVSGLKYASMETMTQTALLPQP